MKSFLLIEKKRFFSFKSRREVEEIDHFQNPYVKRSEKTATESKDNKLQGDESSIRSLQFADTLFKVLKGTATVEHKNLNIY